MSVSDGAERPIMPRDETTNYLVLPDLLNRVLISFRSPWPGIEFRPVHLVFISLLFISKKDETYIEHAILVNKVQTPTSHH
jgi:hypothetical protein